MIRHIALIQFKDEVTQQDVDNLEAGLGELPGKIEAIRAYAFGRDLAITEGTWDFAIVADFDNVESFHAYRTDPHHVEVLTNLSGPLTADIRRIQFEF